MTLITDMSVCSSSSRAAQPQPQVIAGGRDVQVFLEHALQLPLRQPHALRDLVEAQRVFDVRFHELRRAHQFASVDADARGHRDVLLFGGAADTVQDELFRHAGGYRVAVAPRHEIQHQVERRGAARTGDAVAVGHEQVFGECHGREFLAQRGQVFPMHGAAIAVHQAGLDQRVAARTEAAQRHAQARQPRQRPDQRAVDVAPDLDAATDEQGLHGGRVVQARGGRDGQAVAARGGRAVGRQHRPAIQRAPADIVGHPQRLDGVDEGDHREVGQQQEAEMAVRRVGRIGLDRQGPAGNRGVRMGLGMHAYRPRSRPSKHPAGVAFAGRRRAGPVAGG